MVLRVVRAVLGPHDAEDAWSEAFLAALRAYPELPADANVEAWLVTIAHRKAVDVTRANARRPLPVAEPPDRPAPTGPPEHWDPDQWDPALWQALKALPDRQRHVLAYHHLAGLPYKDIAALTGGTAEAARRAAADGMRTLRRTYPRKPDDPPDADPAPARRPAPARTPTEPTTTEPKAAKPKTGATDPATATADRTDPATRREGRDDHDRR